MLISAAWLGFIVFMMFLVLKRINFHNTPTPVYVIAIWIATLTTMHVIISGLIEGNWGGLVLKLIFIYIGFICFLYFSGDMAYYRNKYLKPQEEPARVYAPEDDPNWPSR